MMKEPTLKLKKLGINTYKEPIIYMRQDSYVCRSEGLEVHARVRVSLRDKFIIATLNVVNSNLLKKNEASLSDYAWGLLKANEDDDIIVSHADPVKSLSAIRSKIYGNKLSNLEFDDIIKDITAGYYSDIQISSFLTACGGNKMDKDEIIGLTAAMIKVGDRLQWDSDIVVDKHCVGGLPGNRTTPIIVPIVTAFGLTMPKTSSRAITSPSGTADTLEVITEVEIDIKTIKKIVNQEGGCFVWGGAISLSPADDILIRVEKALNLDSEGQLIASVLSKKISAGSNRILIDIPIGPTAKVRSLEMAQTIKEYFEYVGKYFGVVVKVIFSDGQQPVGRGIGPALEMRDIIAVLKCQKDAPLDLRQRALALAGHIIEFSNDVTEGEGLEIATKILDSGLAWQKFQAISIAQGGIKEVPTAKFIHNYKSQENGMVTQIDNRQIALIAKLAGAPNDKVAGVDLHVQIGSLIKNDEDLFSIHADSPGEIEYVLDYLNENPNIIKIE